MIILVFKASKFDKKQNSLLLDHIMHIAHFLDLNRADMRLIPCRWVTFLHFVLVDLRFCKYKSDIFVDSSAPNVRLILAQSLQHSPNVNLGLGQRFVFVKIYLASNTHRMTS